MGCHTWAYRKVKENEIEETKEAWISDIKQHHIAYFETEKDEESKFHEYLEILEEYKDCPDCERLTEEQYRELNTELHKLIKSIQVANTLSDLVKLWDNEVESFVIDLMTKYVVYDDSLYVFVACDSPYRVYGYPEEVFTDSEKFIQWLTDTEREHTEEDDKAIRKFWEKYDNEVYIEFG